jgi:hypothetical protein
VNVSVEGIVAYRNKEPYVILKIGSEKAQLTIAEAHKIAKDVIVMAARTEADAMLVRFFESHQLPEAACAAMMQEFRLYRLALESDTVTGTIVDPDTGETI